MKVANENKIIINTNYLLTTNFLVLFMGISYSILGILSTFTDLNPKYLFTISIVGFLFILNDFLSIFSSRRIDIIRIPILLLSMLILTILPNYELVFTLIPRRYENLFTLLGFGLAIAIIGIKDFKKNNKETIIYTDEIMPLMNKITKVPYSRDSNVIEEIDKIYVNK